MGPKPNLLCDDHLATDGIAAPCRQHPFKTVTPAAASLCLGSEGTGAQTRSDQRFVEIHCRFY
jgi:hypothetical protein